MSKTNNRRCVLQAALGTGIGLLMPQCVLAQTDPRSARPQEGDRLVYADGEQKGKPVAPDSLPLGGPPANAYAQDAASGTVRSTPSSEPISPERVSSSRTGRYGAANVA